MKVGLFWLWFKLTYQRLKKKMPIPWIWIIQLFLSGLCKHNYRDLNKIMIKWSRIYHRDQSIHIDRETMIKISIPRWTLWAETAPVVGSITVRMVYSFTSLDSASLHTKNNIFSFLVKCSLFKLENSYTVILPPIVTVLCFVLMLS